jgi:hypothetical protein
MPVRTVGVSRGVAVAILAGLLAAGCDGGSSTSQKVEVARFEGIVDQATGTVQIRMLPPEGTARLASVSLPVDTTPGRGVGTASTVELATEWVSRTDLAGVTTGGHPCGKPGSLCALVTMRSYYATSEIHNLYAEIYDLLPTSHNGFAVQPDPGNLGLDGTYGLWAYPALLDSTRGAVGGAAPGANAASVVWYFNNTDNANFTFKGRVMGDVVPTTATGYNALCGVAETALTTTTNCGECGRTAPLGTTCSYTGNGSGSQGTANLVSTVTCSNGALTACMTAVANQYQCLNLQTDAANCGACGNACSNGATCSAGVCNSVTCPAGTTLDNGTCVVSSATGVAVGSSFACATTSSAWLQQSWWYMVQNHLTPAFETNVLCWGNTPINRAGQSTPPAALPWTFAQPYVDYLEDNTHLTALWTDHTDICCGGDTCEAFSTAYAAAQGHPRIAYFFGANYGNSNYVTGLPTLATKLSLGANHGVAIYPDAGTPSHHVLSWGSSNTHYQQGFGTTADNYGYPQLALPALLNPQRNVNYMSASDIAAGGNTSCAVLEAPDGFGNGPGQTAGHVVCWGQNDSGQASGVAGADVPMPAVVAGVSGAIAVSVGLRHSVAYDGANLHFWGDNSGGQFGGAATPPITTINPGRSVSSLAAGADVTCYVSGGTVYCAGRNNVGQLGQGDTGAHSGFVAVPGVTGATWVSVSTTSGATAATVCAVASGARIYCWGDNSSGQIGIGAAGGHAATPTLVQMQHL